MSKVTFKERVIGAICRVLPAPLAERLWNTQTDNCQVCKGAKGGVRGNENVVDGVVMCDFCTISDMDAKAKARRSAG